MRHIIFITILAIIGVASFGIAVANFIVWHSTIISFIAVGTMFACYSVLLWKNKKNN